MGRSEYPSILDRLGLGPPVSVSPVGGGCIARACTAQFVDGSTVFVKTLSHQPGLFEAEAEGLKALRRTQAIRVPQVLAVEPGGLVLEQIREGPRTKGFAENFGRRFAQLHQYRGRACGFSDDNFIGATPQINAPVDDTWQDARNTQGSDWPEFFIERRLRFQVRLASERGHGDELARLLDRAEARIAALLNSAIEEPSLLHGDLWGGNYLVDDRGEPCLIDPAVYFGHREADLAMTRLFGGFESAFYSAYNDALPLVPGHRERLPIYQLYHVINHLNLFGGGYYGQAQRILQNLAG